MVLTTVEGQNNKMQDTQHWSAEIPNFKEIEEND